MLERIYINTQIVQKEQGMLFMTIMPLTLSTVIIQMPRSRSTLSDPSHNAGIGLSDSSSKKRINHLTFDTRVFLLSLIHSNGIQREVLERLYKVHMELTIRPSGSFLRKISRYFQ